MKMSNQTKEKINVVVFGGNKVGKKTFQYRFHYDNNWDQDRRIEKFKDFESYLAAQIEEPSRGVGYYNPLPRHTEFFTDKYFFDIYLNDVYPIEANVASDNNLTEVSIFIISVASISI